LRSRTVALGTAGAGAATVAWWALWGEPRAGVVRRRTLHLPHWPASLAGLRVAVFSDLHAGAPQVDEDRVARLAARVSREGADLVTILGDLVDPEGSFAREVTPEAVAARLGTIRARLGVVAVLGNHDWRYDGERVRAALQAAGMTVLEDDVVDVGRGLHVAGVADATERSPDVEATLARVPDGAPLIVLSHDPDLFPRIPARAALTLSGHTHGGQVAIPRLRRRVIPSRFGERYARGHIVEGGRHLYVTSGVGTSGHPIRFLAPPEVVVLRLEPERR
jgi:hypothetical protein